MVLLCSGEGGRGKGGGLEVKVECWGVCKEFEIRCRVLGLETVSGGNDRGGG